MKKTIIALIMLVSFVGNAQDLEKWQVGFNLNPFIFNRINSDYEPQKAKQDILNGFGIGVTIEKNWNEHWGIKTGFEYSWQNEKYDNYWFTGNVYKTTVDADFNYYKIPITVQYYHPITEKLFLTFNQGFQVSLLSDYKTIIEDELEYLTITPDQYDFISKRSPKDSNTHYNYGWFYKKQTFGLIGSIGLKGFLSQKISYSTNLRYEYDLSGADTEMNFFSYNENTLSTYPNTKNFRLGLELGLQYNFSLAGCGYCKNQKH
jgi:hypothetical protein